MSSSNTSDQIEYDITNIADHPRYDLVLNLVLRDEKKESIYKRLEANKVSEDESDLLFKKALRQRISLIRSQSYRKIYQGLAVMAVAFMIFSFCRYQMKAIHLAILILCIMGFVSGFWLVSDGIGRFLYASNHRGEIANIMNE